MAGPVTRLWMHWKSLKLPWRRQRLVGSDLAGNTFWEFKDALNSNRFRRIVRYSKNAIYADVKVSPQWHQWLRHTRTEPPSLHEQQIDVVRQASMKELARQADERWASKPSFLDAPDKQQAAPATLLKDPGGHASQSEPTGKQGVRSAVGADNEVLHSTKGHPIDQGRFKGESKDTKSNPWARSQSKVGEPSTWLPGVAARR